jgi:hypothetical protein
VPSLERGPAHNLQAEELCHARLVLGAERPPGRKAADDRERGGFQLLD